MPTCQSYNRVWIVPPKSSSSPVHRRTGKGWCAGDPAARWGWNAQTGCWSGPTAWPAGPCLLSRGDYPAKQQPLNSSYTISSQFLWLKEQSDRPDNHLEVLNFRKIPCPQKSLRLLRPEWFPWCWELARLWRPHRCPYSPVQPVTPDQKKALSMSFYQDLNQRIEW